MSPSVKTCAVPTVTNGGVDESSPVNYLTTFTPNCNTGYESVNSTITALTCQADTSLSPSHPGCTSKFDTQFYLFDCIFPYIFHDLY